MKEDQTRGDAARDDAARSDATRGKGDAATRRCGSAAPLAECLWLSARSIINLRGYASGRRSLKFCWPGRKGKAFPQGERPSRVFVALLLVFTLLALGSSGFAQERRATRKGSHPSALPEGISSEARELVERAIEVVCTERRKDPKGSHPIDEMQARPSLPVYSAEALVGAQRAQRLLPIAKGLVATAIEELATEYRLPQTKIFKLRLQQAIGRVQIVRRVKADMASRDNASVFLRRPQTITFGTIFLAGLPSDEAMISVLAHELVHIADGDGDSLKLLFRAVGKRASGLTGIRIYQQRAEELTCDLVGTMAARLFISETPDYSPLPQRISRAVQHNCVEDDEGDEDHLSPRNTIRALLALSPSVAHELVYGRVPSRSIRRN